MEKFTLVSNKAAVPFLIEESALLGVKKIAEKVFEDIEKVSGVRPAFCASGKEELTHTSDVVFVGTVGCSPLVEAWLAEGRLESGNLKSDREVFSFQWMENPFSEKGRMLAIVGSDKRGTIYGLFRLSELIGVSAMHYFGDAVIEKKEVVQITAKPYFSKQPSVTYRGFFINDEWPAFGNWCTDTFGDVNAEAYDKIFELLLRMRGNYLWPAMWNSSFSEDGPGTKSAELADLYGVVMGTSHHEPLCRAGVEWQRKYQEYSTDSSWDFIGNGEAISKFWEDGIIRNKPFENVITVGMRGENDSKLLAENATMADNVEVIKKAIRAQHQILRRQMGEDLSSVPRMLAIYKEVEQYYYGDETCEGLKDWDELQDVIFLLSDDNHGNLRSLPTESERSHPGGFGMYYHLDYHGGPISYEWVNSTKISKVWEQMTTAYEYGVKEMWIVNVGDLKGVEYPLNFFMDLAYDYDTWGIQGREKVPEYPEKWLRRVLGESVEASLIDDVKDVLNGYIAFNAVRRPEYTNANVYHPIHLMEGQRVMAACEALLEKAETVHESLEGALLEAYESTVYYSAVASLHLHLLNVYAGYNHLLAERGSLAANRIGDIAVEHLHKMEQAVSDFHAFKNGKWNHMMASAHTGFRTWDDYNWTYPVIHRVEPIPCAKAMVSFRHSDRYDLGSHWQNTSCDIAQVSVLGETLWIDIDSRGSVPFDFEVQVDGSFLELSKTAGHVEPDGDGRDSIALRYCPVAEVRVGNGVRDDVRNVADGGSDLIKEREAAAAGGSDLAKVCEAVAVGGGSGSEKECEAATVVVKIRFQDGSKTEMKLRVEQDISQCLDSAGRLDMEGCLDIEEGTDVESVSDIVRSLDIAEGSSIEGSPGIAEGSLADDGRESEKTAGDSFVQTKGCVAINAAHYVEKYDSPEGAYLVIPDRGRFKDAIKCFPVNKDFTGLPKGDRPSVSYAFRVPKEAAYDITFELVPANPDHFGGRFTFDYSINGGDTVSCPVVAADYNTEYANREWDFGVVNHVRKVRKKAELKAGQNSLTIYAGEPGLVLERIILTPQGKPLPESYLGPEESRCSIRKINNC